MLLRFERAVRGRFAMACTIMWLWLYCCCRLPLVNQAIEHWSNGKCYIGGDAAMLCFSKYMTWAKLEARSRHQLEPSIRVVESDHPFPMASCAHHEATSFCNFVEQCNYYTIGFLKAHDATFVETLIHLLSSSTLASFVCFCGPHCYGNRS